MEVYIEFVILDNLIINSLIIMLLAKTFSVKLRKINVLASVIIGTTFAVLMPLLTINSAVLFFMKIALGMIMVGVLKKYNTFNEFVLYFLVFLTYTFAIGGVFFASLVMLNQSTNLNQAILFGNSFPISLIFLVLYLYVYVLLKAIKPVKNKKTHNNQITTFIITHQNKSYNIKGFLDTGNQLYENGQAVVVISQRLFLKIFTEITHTQLFLNKLSGLGLKDLSYINIGAVSGTKKLPIITLDKAEINKITHKNIRAAISYTSFNADFDCILHPDIFLY